MTPVRLFAIVALGALAGCQAEQTPAPEDVFGAERIAYSYQTCLERGGSFQRAGGAGAYVCVTRTRDAGRQCRRSTDCESGCLARSGTCAPLTPLIGCNEVFNAAGLRVNECIE